MGSEWLRGEERRRLERFRGMGSKGERREE